MLRLLRIQLWSGFCLCVWANHFLTGLTSPLECESLPKTHTSTHSGPTCQIPFCSDSSFQTISLARHREKQTPHPRNYLFNSLAFMAEQLRWGRTEAWFQQQPKQFGVCSLRVRYTKTGEGFILFHSSWKKLSLSHDIICTLILENFNPMPFSSQGGLWNYNPSVRIRLIEFDC